MNPIKALQKHGQAIWLDFLARNFIAHGDLKGLIDQDGVRGVTSNPSIFEKAIAGSTEYDQAIARLLGERDRSVGDLYETLAVEDIQNAADVLRPVYDALHGDDGYVSLEVSPYLARDTAGTIAEAERLWRAVRRDNLMIKVPGTPEGLPAIEALIAQGINVNVTLLFSQQLYASVLDAYIAGLEKWVAGGGDPKRIASVASFFVSRIDSAVDKDLDGKIAAANDADKKAALEALKGKVAIANAKLAYQHYRNVIATERWAKLAEKGARVQRLLWASTGTKNKAYSDVLYVEELIGQDTVNTVPPATLDAFRDHGKLRDSLEENVPEAERVLAELARAGISLEAITDRLVEEGVTLFAEAFDKLLGAVAHKRATLLSARIDGQSIRLAPDVEAPFRKLADTWRAGGLIRSLWARDAAVWTGQDEAKWLGWLDAVTHGQADLSRYQAFAQWVRLQGFTDAVVLGMGGSSLGPEVIATTFGHVAGFPRLTILDSTDPAQIRRTEASIKLATTLFIVSSKSGGTTEPNALMDYFFARVGESQGDKAGQHFVAVTDPGSSLEKTARTRGFAHVFHGDPSIGGRYSVLSPFGLVPAAATGLDLGRFLEAAASMVRACGPDVPPDENPGVQLGLALGAAALLGKDKVTLTASAEIGDFGAWVEQLIAESTGKNGKALIPLEGETLGTPEVYGHDRVFVDLSLKDDHAREATLAALEKAGHPVVRIAVTDPLHIGQEFFRFEIATAVAGAVIGINPFDQPDVEAAKVKTRELTAAFESTGALPAETAVVTDGTIAIYTDAANAAALRKAGADGSVASWLKAHFGRIKSGDYAALLAYVDRDDAHIAAAHALRMAIRDRRHVATCVGFGPRFLHSTGQAYKGGPDSGVFLQITADDTADLAVPGHKASFGVIKAAQARGDFDVLTERGRRALRLHIKGDLAKGLAAIRDAADSALS
ncbi:bifunctional transaldolase/phosoglucose isomerase [Bradyrhizobium sp. U87765 SZCCT0131]|uniref:bifunctional transaldolase/phosoglucose isomerase n=1 Tax=unclassified Bradyrhizobium TaxID=2631580 RepID=UPI001BAA7599|nr:MULTISPECIES: bifunctional transaldolase/phosoglucose isomerase [unclassified Bradyrhizobium]MBR1218312.1 bifunctional transaldolase/phosoglucose isomerase [Bradyrhizobium sp. U87765 SZCCT0131]MBR1260742.1 bifunctional transaldolase/phosoglucose isomerase [Bradyrhizobium sp. U87765 SZCCT0134]MBR1303810.1 bifunctional transaldolase/phosoglucose isomerase [Bradyrhizobium sp. U87765 SZCCT0110]MBR1319416.1 bifunctional transaldolase/phosoglucose isomerase [Bradyrhizobium sp. U87765 SZCCT0109]MB